MTLTAKERKGAELHIQRISGQQVKGELIAVKKNSLLLKESKSGADICVDVKNVMVIIIKKKSKALLGGGIGLLVGGGLGWAIKTSTDEGSIDQEAVGLVIGIALVPIGLIGGALIGSHAGKAEKIQIEGMPPAMIEHYLEDLRKKARVPDFQ